MFFQSNPIPYTLFPIPLFETSKTCQSRISRLKITPAGYDADVKTRG